MNILDILNHIGYTPARQVKLAAAGAVAGKRFALSPLQCGRRFLAEASANFRDEEPVGDLQRRKRGMPRKQAAHSRALPASLHPQGRVGEFLTRARQPFANFRV